MPTMLTSNGQPMAVFSIAINPLSFLQQSKDNSPKLQRVTKSVNSVINRNSLSALDTINVAFNLTEK